VRSKRVGEAPSSRGQPRGAPCELAPSMIALGQLEREVPSSIGQAGGAGCERAQSTIEFGRCGGSSAGRLVTLVARTDPSGVDPPRKWRKPHESP
jgi:hypothetical protein